MRRIVEPTRILFVERNLGWSLIFFASSLIALVLYAVAGERRSDPTSEELGFYALLGAVGLFAAAFWLLFRMRLFVVELDSRELTIVERNFLKLKKYSCPLEDVRVKMEQKRLQNRARSLEYELWVGAIWLDVEEKGRVPFLSDLRGADAQHLVEQLAEDLGRPLDVVDRRNW
jgi:hypothetical protein